ncbi:MAG TPA: UTP--glucose-1-phosphate uridylyltransferase GalU [Bacillota bacterium]
MGSDRGSDRVSGRGSGRRSSRGFPRGFARVRKGVIPAAGLGTRFLPATKAQPKEMLPIVDRPIIQYIVEEAAAAGLETLLIITGRGKRAIEDHFDVSVELEAHLSRRGDQELAASIQKISDAIDIFFVRQKRPRGLGDAIRTARRFIGEEPFAVLLGDELFHGNRPCLSYLLDAYAETGETVVAVQEVARSEVHRYGIIDPDPSRAGAALVRARDLVEKPSPGEAPSQLAVVGRYVIRPEVFEILADLPPGVGGEIQLTDALRHLARDRDVYACRVPVKRYDVGSRLGFLQATVEYALRNPEHGGPFAAYLEQLRLRQPVDG